MYTLLTTIFLVNLMIAQMTKSYESIKAESFLYRRLERVNIVIEYKDFRYFKTSLSPPCPTLSPIHSLRLTHSLSTTINHTLHHSTTAPHHTHHSAHTTTNLFA